ncbi:transposase family protein [Lachnospiraceae bacterium OttesenSCG-928-D06]|nr:transposase family protein [Lachnospiraceae bacterium OttesenSCG-928-D06]
MSEIKRIILFLYKYIKHEEFIYMYFTDIIREIYIKNEYYFDVVLDDKMPIIIDYRYMDKAIEISTDFNIIFENKKNKQEIKTIDDLQSIMKELILDVRKYFYCSIIKSNSDYSEDPLCAEEFNKYFDIKDDYMNILVNQLVFDILFDKYLEDESKNVMSLSKYCAEHFYFDIDDTWIKKINHNNFPINSATAKDTAYHMMKRQEKRVIRNMDNPELEKPCREFGIDFNKDITAFIESKERSKIIWDHIFHEGNNKLITSKQYRRNFVIDRNEDYIKLANELNDYDKYVEGTLIKNIETDSDKNFFCKSMSFYLLEKNNRIDFMYKIAGILERKEDLNFNKIKFLMKGFTAHVACPYIAEDEEGMPYLDCDLQAKYYPPIMLTEKSCSPYLDKISEEYESNPFLDDEIITIFRIKAYELFKYHYTFVFENYGEVSDFIRNNYDILSYHKSNKIWNDIKENQLTFKQKERLDNIIEINNYLFPEISNSGLSRAGWRNINKNKVDSQIPVRQSEICKLDETKLKCLKDRDYPIMFGMEKETFEQILSKLESVFKERQTHGGRPAKLSVLNKLIVAIEYTNNNRTMQNIADAYGISKSRISDAVKWVEETISKDTTLSLQRKLNENHGQT